MEENATQVRSMPTRESGVAYGAAPHENPTIELVLLMASRLALAEQLRVIQVLAEQLSLKTQALAMPKPPQKSRSLHGLLAEFGPGPSAEEIDESRREMLANFPREDF